MDAENEHNDGAPPAITPGDADSRRNEGGTPLTPQNPWSNANETSIHSNPGNEFRVKVRQRQHILERINIERMLPQLNSLSLHELEAKLSVLERQYEAFHQLQTELELLNDQELHQSHRDEFEDSFCAARALIMQRINIMNPVRRETLFNSTAFAPSSHRVNLPKLQLTKFNGHHRNWLDFHNMFVVLVHNNNQLANVEKFQYLRSCLVDSAANLIQSLEVTDENYIRALDLLRARYGNKRLIFQAHIQHIFEIQSETISTASSLRAFIDVVNTNLRAVQSLATNQQVSDGILLHLVTAKLDTETKAKWEEEVTHSFDQRSTAMSLNLPTWEDLSEFLERRSQIVDILEAGLPKTSKQRLPSATTTQRSGKPAGKWALAAIQAGCEFCKRVPHHNAFKCETFMGMDPLGRYNCAKRLNLCLNCLGSGHKSNDCPSVHRCKHCGVKHHTLLHRKYPISDDTTNSNNSQRAGVLSSSALKVSVENLEVILGTALIHMFNSRGVHIQGRALLDSGSQLHFVTERLAQHLRLTRKGIDMQVIGIGQGSTRAQHTCCITIKSQNLEFTATIEAIIIPSITSCQPIRRIDASRLAIPNDCYLADPTFHIPGQIDMLIGAALFFELLLKEKLQLNGPVLQNTKLGWVVAGAISETSITENTPILSSSPYMARSLLATEPSLDKQLERFWALEDMPSSSPHSLSSDEMECESFFKQTTRRCPITSKFIVRLPFREDPNCLGDSKDIAIKRMISLENKLIGNPMFRQEYNNFIDEYINMNHMTAVNPTTDTRNSFNYIPHHGVTKMDSSTTKLRVVFDASCKTTSGYSLNDVLRVGPQLQDTIFTILIRFRKHKYVIIADIAKMYRQIWVDERDAQWQCILWRPSPQQPFLHYQLQTVTYGTSCAPYLAVKCLQQVAIEESYNYPIGAEITLRDFYVDNLISGADNIADVIEIKNQTTELLKCAGFPLRKFASNASEIIEDVSMEDREETIHFHDTEFIKTLGLKWSPSEDCFLFDFAADIRTKITKRLILSKLASFFDPLGLLNPLIVTCKIYMQQLWKLNCSWDDPVPPAIGVQWEHFSSQLPLLKQLKIPRYAQCNKFTEFHAFADASTKAFGACVYAAWSDSSGNHSTLLCAKSRVAPTKQITLPRLELSAAVLAAELMSSVRSIFNQSDANIFFWSDSTITLAWIAGEPTRWNVFVANRVTKIQHLTKTFNWNHVPTSQNPADIVSRGAHAGELVQSPLWWHGPEFLRQQRDHWPVTVQTSVHEVPEQRSQRCALIAKPITDLISDHKYVNRYMKLLRIFAYVNRFIRACRKQSETNNNENLSISDLKDALHLICRHIQYVTFSGDIHMIQNGQLKRSSKIISLSPFMHHGLLRVGGRIKNSSLPFDSKHPILLPSSHIFVYTLIRHFHQHHLHASTQTLQNILRDKFWIINARNVIRKVIHGCILCYRTNPIIGEQIMGNLPSDRVNQTYPFEVTGVDYCGPVLITQRIRGRPPIKSYVSVFICFTTKAVHLEVVPDLSTQSFIAALKRFIARRGKCRKLISDNATNFVGANRELRELLATFISKEHCESVQQACLADGIEWQFIPPRSPHFGGLWESAVKLAKYFLRRALGTSILSLDELQTVCCQAEAIINSRPLTPISSDANDLRPLTPAHFLVGRPLTTISEPTETNPNDNLLKRHQLVQRIHQQFWERWRCEYITNLQQRTKWKSACQNLKVDDMVLMKDDNTPPLMWPIGRVTEVKTGEDGHVRVVIVRTANGFQTRAIAKVLLIHISTHIEVSLSSSLLALFIAVGKLIVGPHTDFAHRFFAISSFSFFVAFLVI